MRVPTPDEIMRLDDGFDTLRRTVDEVELLLANVTAATRDDERWVVSDNLRRLQQLGPRVALAATRLTLIAEDIDTDASVPVPGDDER